MFSKKKNAVDIMEKKQLEMSSTAEKIAEIVGDLSQAFNKSVRPLEGVTGFNMHCMGPIGVNHLDQKPSCLFMGSYSSGKTTAIRFLLQSELAELRVGPEPTTDIFHVLTYGHKQFTSEGVILMNDPSLGFQHFSPQNKDLARHFRLTRIPNICLKAMDLIDSPGFLSGDNMLESRGYDLPSVLSELAKRATRIYMMMDVAKVDVSPECKESLRRLRPVLGKMRLIFNKADSVDSVNLMRLYGALMYLTGQAVAVPEVPRVFVCSLWDHPYSFIDFRELFDQDKLELLNDLKRLPVFHYPHIVGNQIERLNCFLIYVVVVRQFRKVMPFFKKDKKKQEIITNFTTFYADALRDEAIMMGDNVVYNSVFEAVKKLDVNNLPDGCTKKTVDLIRQVIESVVPRVLTRLNEILNDEMDDNIQGGVFEIVEASNKLIENEEAHKFCLSDQDIEKADQVFATFRTHNGRVDATQIRTVMLESKLPHGSLAKVWDLARDSTDGKMDMYEWRVASFLVSYLLTGKSLPTDIPTYMRPSSMRPAEARRTPSVPHAFEDNSD